MLKRIFLLSPVLLLPALLTAQTPKRATHVRGEAVGLDNQPVTPAAPAGRANGATPAMAKNVTAGTPRRRAASACGTAPLWGTDMCTPRDG